MDRHKIWFSLSGAFFLTALLPVMIFTATGQLHFASKAATSEAIHAPENLIGGESAGFSLDGDPLVWKVQESKSATETEYLLSITPDVGSATIHIVQSVGSKDHTASIERVKAEELQSANRRFVRQETHSIARSSADRLVFSEEHFGQSSEYTIDVLDTPVHLYRIVVRTDGSYYIRQSVQQMLDTFHLTGPSPQVQGASSERLERYEFGDLTEVVRPSVVNILYRHCHVALPNKSFIFFTAPFRFCLDGKGTGFFVTPDGIVATAGHVVTTHPHEALGKNLKGSALKPLLSNLLQEVTVRNTGKKISLDDAMHQTEELQSNPTAFQGFTTAVYTLLDQDLIHVNPDGEYYVVNFGTTPFLSDPSAIDDAKEILTSETILPATLLDREAPDHYSADAILRKQTTFTQDVALLKVEHSTLFFPALPLAPELARVGETVMVSGFPELVAGGGKGAFLDYNASSISPSMTAGIVSAIKQDTAGHILIQTDASVSSGTSGGPAVNRNGEVIGLAAVTFNAENGNYNFLRDREEITMMLKEHQENIETKNPTLAQWKTGLDAYRSGNMQSAKHAFAKVLKLYPPHPLVGSILDDIAKQEQRGNVLLGFRKDRVIFFGTSTWVVVFSLLGLMATLRGMILMFRNRYALL